MTGELYPKPILVHHPPPASNAIHLEPVQKPPRMAPTIRFQTPLATDPLSAQDSFAESFVLPPDPPVALTLAQENSTIPKIQRLPSPNDLDLGLESYLKESPLPPPSPEEIQICLHTKLIAQPIVHMTVRKASMAPTSIESNNTSAAAAGMTGIPISTGAIPNRTLKSHAQAAPNPLTTTSSSNRPKLDMNDMVHLVKAEDQNEAKKVSDKLRQSIRKEASEKRKSASNSTLHDSMKKTTFGNTGLPISSYGIDSNQQEDHLIEVMYKKGLSENAIERLTKPTKSFENRIQMVRDRITRFQAIKSNKPNYSNTSGKSPFSLGQKSIPPLEKKPTQKIIPQPPGTPPDILSDYVPPEKDVEQ